MENQENINQPNIWKNYHEETRDIPPRPLLKEAADLVSNKDEALDLGSGALNDTKYLASLGFKHITAVDRTPAPSEFADSEISNKITCVQSTFDTFHFETEFYDLINAHYSLPFNSPETFAGMFKKLKSSLKIGGIFAGQFFGTKDEWNTPQRKNMTFHTKEEILELLDGMEILKLTETEKGPKTVDNKQKHWHLFIIIAKKI